MIVRNHLGNRILLSLCVFAAATLISPDSHADLQKYLDKPEPAFEWQVKTKIAREQSGDRIYDLQFVSQTWRGEKWRHQLQVYQPADATPAAKMLLWVTGGSASAQTNALGLELARKIKAPVAFVYHIPNQPLLEGNLSEDDLIAETFVRYLKSGDDNWPLLLPMVKSVVKAMDVLQAFSKQEWRRARRPVHRRRRFEARLDHLADSRGRSARRRHRAGGHRRAQHARADVAPDRSFRRL